MLKYGVHCSYQLSLNFYVTQASRNSVKNLLAKHKHHRNKFMENIKILYWHKQEVLKHNDSFLIRSNMEALISDSVSEA